MPFECHICGAHFRQQGQRSRHIRDVHLKEKPHQCGVCGMSFARKGALEVHTRKHNEEKSYQCTICQKRFAHKQTLTDHAVVHTGLKPHHCTTCGDQFTMKRTLRRHSAKGHKEDMDVAMQQQVEIETSSLFQPKIRKLKASMEKACFFIVMLLRHFFSLSAVQK